MSHNTLRVLTIVAAAGAVALIVACRAPAQGAGGGAEGRYGVAAGGEQFVLYDAATGKSWLLNVEGSQEDHAWTPIQRLDTEEQIIRWRVTKRARGAR